MAHFALVENGEVKNVIVVSNDDCGGGAFPESEPIGQKFIASLGLEGEWKQTSYNSNFRSNYAFIGGVYDSELDAFIEPKPFDSWTLNSSNQWVAPVPYPDENEAYFWDDALQKWILIAD
jgi:hypothetical protein